MRSGESRATPVSGVRQVRHHGREGHGTPAHDLNATASAGIEFPRGKRRNRVTVGGSTWRNTGLARQSGALLERR